MKTPEQLKGTIRSMAAKKNLRAQEVLQMFLFERILERMANSRFKDNFILKGGLLIGSLSLKVLTHISKASVIKCLTNKWHFLSEDKSFYTIYTNLYSNPPKNYTNL